MNWLDAGWQVTGHDPDLSAWVEAVLPVALALSRDPGQQAAWLRHGKTWFAGVDVLPNDADGRVAQDAPPLACEARRLAEGVTGALPLHPAQVSVTYPGYPGRDPADTDAAHRYRRDRDAAHLDGLLPVGPDRRRHLLEPHGYILGVPLTDSPGGKAPLVVWEGSHHVIRDAFTRAFEGTAPGAMPEIDLTEVYQAARRRCFESCRRVEVTARPGQAILLHRMTIHGVAPWTAPAAGNDLRAIAYLRPILPGGVADWLRLP